MAARPPPKHAQRRHRLLYVDDDALSVALVHQVVQCRRDLVLVVAADMDAAMNHARRERPEVMLINLDLVAVRKAGLIQVLRGHPATQTTPILGLGIDAAAETAVRALEAGFFHYLVKPLQASPLIEALDYALEFAALERSEL